MNRTASMPAADPRVAEICVVFECNGHELPGVLHRPEAPARRGVVVVVGGPQTRVGSHRQFTLLARDLAAAGFPVLRFDYRGMGDAGGEFVGFEDIGDDIRIAVDALQGHCPEVTEVVLWGLCDAATASVFYAHTDARVTGLVLLNPWVRTEQGEAEAYLRHYYVRRLLQRDFWRGLISGQVRLARSASSLLQLSLKAGKKNLAEGKRGSLAERMETALDQFEGALLFILSGNDLTAQEFIRAADRSKIWRRIMAAEQTTVIRLPEANHTFSRRNWRHKVSLSTRRWLDELDHEVKS